MAVCLVSVGSNLGNRAESVRDALLRIDSLPQVTLLAQSLLWKTLPAGGPADQEPYLNGAILVDAKNSPRELLHDLEQIERELGRTREARWGPRTIDLDILLFGDEVVAEDDLCVPHPRMAFRRFVLEPAAQIAPEMIHPELNMSIGEMLEHLDVAPPYVAIAGPIGSGKTHLAKNIQLRLPGVRCLWEEIDPDLLVPFYSNPTVHGWAVEIQFLERRAALLESLALDRTDAAAVTISDFWFDQSAAFARLWLTEEQYSEYERHYLDLRQRMPRPRLLVMLQHPARGLLERIAKRGRLFEQGLQAGQLERLGQLLDEYAKKFHRGPVLRLDAQCEDLATEEVHAAIEAMTLRGVRVD